MICILIIIVFRKQLQKATSESKFKGIKFMLKTLKYKNNLNEWKHNKYKFKKNVTEAIIIGND